MKHITREIYIAEDGTEFATERECKKYEGVASFKSLTWEIIHYNSPNDYYVGCFVSNIQEKNALVKYAKTEWKVISPTIDDMIVIGMNYFHIAKTISETGTLKEVLNDIITEKFIQEKLFEALDDAEWKWKSMYKQCRNVMQTLRNLKAKYHYS